MKKSIDKQVAEAQARLKKYIDESFEQLRADVAQEFAKARARGVK